VRFGTYHVFQCPPGQEPGRVIAEELARAELAEALGFDDVWVPEQHFSPYCLAGDALLLAGHLAARTQRFTQFLISGCPRIFPDVQSECGLQKLPRDFKTGIFRRPALFARS